jgi:2-phospho-L-lactate guanylyltransferase
LVPVKPFASAKMRLADVLSDEARAALSREFLRHTLGVLAQAPGVGRTMVVTRDPAALALAAEWGAAGLAEHGTRGLNAALTQAGQAAREGGAEAVLVLPTDLPLLSAADVATLASQAQGERMMVVAPDRREQGTNALLVRPPDAVPFAFGEGSFARHQALAEQAGMTIRVCRLPRVALDVDLPDDLALLRGGDAAPPEAIRVLLGLARSPEKHTPQPGG